MLPASLSPIENYFFIDDHDDYPMVVWYRMRIRGQLDHDALADAFQATVARHPLLVATVDDQTRRHPRWLESRNAGLSIHVDQPLNESGFPEAQPMDIRTQPGTHVFLNDFGDLHQITLQVHHCCSDAIGVQHFLTDVLCEYGKRRSSCPLVSTIRKLDPRRFRKRSTPAIPRWKYTIGVHRLVERCKDVARILSGCPAQLCRSSTASPRDEIRLAQSEPTGEFGVSVGEWEFDRAQTDQILEASRNAGVSVNSTLLGSLFETILEWRTNNGIHRQEDRLRICVPVNLRTQKDRALTAANAISLLFVDRNYREILDRENLVRGVDLEVRQARRDMWLTFIATLSVARMLPGKVVQKFTRKNQAWSTCLFSNVGVAFRELSAQFDDGEIDLGGATVESWSFLPPLRKALGLSIGCSTFAGKLKIACHYDQDHLSSSEVHSLLKSWTDSILGSDSLAQPAARSSSSFPDRIAV